MTGKGRAGTGSKKAYRSTRRDVLRAGAGALLAFSGAVQEAGRVEAAPLNITNYYSSRNSRRPQRPQTHYIVLHTTEGGEKGSLKKIRRRGEAHYFVTRQGRVYRIIDKSRIATHAGRSMWEGQKVIDNYSIGIEVVGYHNREINAAQYSTLRELLRQLKSLYKIPDRHVLTHSMVAYGRPNRFHRYNHRGRKRCGMIFSRPDVRERLGLNEKPAEDADVVAGRLKVADAELHSYLYARPSQVASAAASAVQEPSESNVITKDWTAWDIARERYDSSDTAYVFPNGTRKAGDQISDWSRIPAGTRVLLAESEKPEGFEGFLEIGKDGDTAWSLAGEAFDDRTTIYFLPSGMVRTGQELKQRKSTRRLLDDLPRGTRVLVGYVYGGHVKKSRLPSRIAGPKWNYPSTYYRFPDGRIVSGDEVDARAIPPHTLIFYQG